MLKFQMALIVLLIGCVALISCGQLVEILTPPMPGEDPIDDGMVVANDDDDDDGMVVANDDDDDGMVVANDDDDDDGMMVANDDDDDDGIMVANDDDDDDGTMPDDGMMTEDMTEAYTSWLSATYAVISPAHPGGDRTVYINDIGAVALQDGMTTFPVGTIVYKDIMDATNTSVVVVERMEKTDDPMYAGQDGWLYNEGATQVGCHGCHARAGAGVPGIDAVFSTDQLIASLAAASMDDGAGEDQ